MPIAIVRPAPAVPLIDRPSERLVSMSVKALISVRPSFQLKRPNRPISSVSSCWRLR